MTHVIYGTTELKNGLVMPWVAFIQSPFREEAKWEAVRIQRAWWKGVTVRCVPDA